MQIVIASIIIQIAAAVLTIKYYRSLPYVALLFITFGLIISGIRNIDITQLADATVFIISIAMLIGIFFTPKIFTLFNQGNKHLKSLEDIDRAMLSSLSHKGVRILAVCDTYSAMTGDRPYRSALSDKETKSEIVRVAGTQLDPEVVDIFLKLYYNKISTNKIFRG